MFSLFVPPPDTAGGSQGPQSCAWPLPTSHCSVVSSPTQLIWTRSGDLILARPHPPALPILPIFLLMVGEGKVHPFLCGSSISLSIPQLKDLVNHYISHYKVQGQWLLLYFETVSGEGQQRLELFGAKGLPQGHGGSIEGVRVSTEIFWRRCVCLSVACPAPT